MALDRLTQITSSGISSISTLTVGAIITVAGVVTAASFRGSGASLTGIVTTKNLTIGTRTTAATISVVGTGMTITRRSGIATVNF